MKELIATLTFLFALPILAAAQNDDHSYRANGYFFFAPIVSNTRYVFNPAYDGVVSTLGEPLPAYVYFHERGGVNTGFGGEALVHKGIGLGAEVGYAGQDWSFGSNGIGVGSANASYHFLSEKHLSKVDPFATGGYSLYFGDRTAFQNGFNLGGGVNLWVAKHSALRLEVRSQNHIHQFHSQFTHYTAFRIGMTFR